jgi:ABC-2 type transport system ATP-binding protein
MTDGIVVHDLAKTYRRGPLGERFHALSGVSLHVRPGEVFGVIGPNGAGKTTLFGCLLGFLTPDSGRITIDGHAPDDLAVRAVTGYLPERLVLDRWMTGFGFLSYHHALARLPAATRKDECLQALMQVGIDPTAGQRPVKSYSRGMLQRLGLAQALLGSPRYVFLDEPASGVDPAGVVLFRRLLGELKGSGVTVLLNSHQLEQVERLCDRVAFVKGGRVEAIETFDAGAGHARGLRIRWASGSATTPDLLRAVAERAGAGFVDARPTDSGGGSGRFTARDDAGAAALLRALIEAGVPVVEATPDEGRLERLFLADAPVGAPAAPAPSTDPGRFMPPDAPGAGS